MIIKAVQTGNWSDPTTWDSDPLLPTAADDVEIDSGIVVTVDVDDAVALSVTVGADGVGGGFLELDDLSALVVTGNVVVNRGSWLILADDSVAELTCDTLILSPDDDNPSALLSIGDMNTKTTALTINGDVEMRPGSSSTDVNQGAMLTINGNLTMRGGGFSVENASFILNGILDLAGWTGGGSSIGTNNENSSVTIDGDTGGSGNGGGGIIGG